MPGPARKPRNQRRRRNSYTGETTLPKEGRKGPAPELPEFISEEFPLWLDAIRRWWVTIWASPMATMWSASDELSLMRLAVLQQRMILGDTKAATEVRQLEDRYGLNPKARNSLGWVIEGEEDGAAHPADGGLSEIEAPKPKARKKARPDPRAALDAPGR